MNVGKIDKGYLDIRKLAIFSILTFGLYYFYWFYRNWVALNKINNKNYRPILRTLGLVVPILNLYLGFSQFYEIRHSAVEKNYKLSFSPTILGIAFWIFYGLWGLPGYYAYLGVLSFLPLIPVQKALNVHFTRERSEKIMFSTLEVVLIIILGFIFLLSIFYR